MHRIVRSSLLFYRDFQADVSICLEIALAKNNHSLFVMLNLFQHPPGHSGWSGGGTGVHGRNLDAATKAPGGC
ncbi:hypothetical protein [Sphingomonas sp. YL-JM2C]